MKTISRQGSFTLNHKDESSTLNNTPCAPKTNAGLLFCLRDQVAPENTHIPPSSSPEYFVTYEDKSSAPLNNVSLRYHSAPYAPLSAGLAPAPRDSAEVSPLDSRSPIEACEFFANADIIDGPTSHCVNYELPQVNPSMHSGWTRGVEEASSPILSPKTSMHPQASGLAPDPRRELIPNTFIVKYSPHYLRDFQCEDQTYISSGRRSESCGAEYVLKTLMEMDDMNVLLVGGFNSGKTTLLYALIREYYGLSKTASMSENNVLFINNLKEQGIQFFRNDMKTFCQTHCSVPGKKKVIMIDDMDSINKQSQQVFRNYIDKYKAHVCVISSCANLQKVVESIQSRLHIVRIQPPAKQQIARVLDRIVQEEVILIDRDCRDYLLERANGNVCNVVNNLEKLKIYATDGVIISRDACEKLCSTISFHQFELYLSALKSGNLREAISIINSLNDYGYSVIDILEYFFEIVKSTENLSEDLKYRIVPYICDYISVFHSVHENSIELSIFTNRIFPFFAVRI